MTPLITSTKASHWYSRDGKACHTSIGAKGQERDTTLRDARKLGLYPSVTTVLNVVANPGLTAWICEQGILAALTLPREGDENDSAFASRVVKDMDSQRDTAAILGRRIHAAIDQLLTHQLPDPEMAPYLMGVSKWLDEAHVEPLSIESDLVSSEWGYGGRLDLYGRICGDLSLIDFKSQNVKRGKANFYDSWPIQLSAYRQLLREKGLPVVKCYSVVIDTNISKPVHVECWPEAKLNFEAFSSAFTIWKYLKSYNPLDEPTHEST